MNIFKRALGRIAIIFVSIALQVILVVLGFLRLVDIAMEVNAVLTIIGVLSVINLFNRDMIPEAKLTWLIVVVVSPVFGPILYYLFSQNRTTKREKLLHQRVMRKTMDLLETDISCLDRVPSNYRGQCRYISSMCHTTPSFGQDILFYPTGEAFFEALVEELRFAKEFVFMEYFIISEGKMWNTILKILIDKARAGVEVRLMYDDIGCLPKLPAGYDQKLRDMGIKCIRYNPFRPVVSAVHNNRDHRKITVIDGMTGFVGGANLADEYINIGSPYGHWKDSAVRIRGRAVQDLTAMFLQMYDVQTGIVEEFSNYIPQYAFSGNDGIVIPFGDAPRPIYEDHVGENVFLNIINQAEYTLYITTPYLILDNKLKTALMTAARRGVDVRIVTPRIPDKKLVFQITRSNYIPLQKAGVKIYEYTPGFIHAKQIYCDGKVAVVGTLNLDYRSLIHHYECGVWMYNTACIKNIRTDFEELFKISSDMRGFKQKWINRIFCSIMAVFTTLL